MEEFGFLRVSEMGEGAPGSKQRIVPYVDGSGIERLLKEQLSEVTSVLTEHYRRVSRVVEDHMEGTRHLKVDLSELRVENQQLRQRLQAAGLSSSVPTWQQMGGTGESSSSESKPHDDYRPAPPSMKRVGQTPDCSAPAIMSIPGSTEVEIYELQMRQNPSRGLGGQATWAQGNGRPYAGMSGSSSAAAFDKVEDFKDSDFRSVVPKASNNDPLPVTDMTMLEAVDIEGAQDKVGGDGEHRHTKMSSDSEYRHTQMSSDSAYYQQHAEDEHRHTQMTYIDADRDDPDRGKESQRHPPKVFRNSFVAPHPQGEATAGPTKAVFADAAAMKEKLRAALHEEEYNVANFYHKKGFWQKIARSTIFDNFTLVVIFANAIWIWIDTDYNDSEVLLEADLGFFVGENAFCVYFAFEWIVRFMAFKNKRDGLKDGWFVFDSGLVFMMVAETWILTLVIALTSSASSGFGGNASVLRLLRLLRLTRMARMARLLRALPELMILIKGIAVATRSVLFTLILLMLIIYVFAIAFTSLTKGTELGDRYFKRVPAAMDTLLLGGTMPDHQDLVDEVGAEHILLKVLFLIFMLLASLTVMNMLMGVLVEVVSVVSAVEKEQMVVNYVKHQLQMLLHTSGIDANHDNQISKAEFESLLEKPEAARALQDVGVDVVGLVDFTDFIFKDDVELSFPDFMEMVLQLRGTNTATVKDIVDFRKFVHAEFDRIEKQMTSNICATLGGGNDTNYAALVPLAAAAQKNKKSA